MTKQIPLTQGKFALIDDEDYERLARYKWFAHHSRMTWYADRNIEKRTGGKSTVSMHREILGVNSKQNVDHVNGNGLDNRRRNLRMATASQNGMNRGPQKDNTSGYKGVSWSTSSQKWHASIKINGRRKHLGFFGTKELAAQAYNKAARKLHGPFAWLNIVK